MIDNRKAVYVAILNQGEVHVELSQYINVLVTNGVYPVHIVYSAHKPISLNRNTIVRNFLEAKDYDYLVMIDSDIVPKRNILDLVLMEKDIIGTLCFALNKEKTIVPLILKRQKKKREDREFMEYEIVPENKWQGLTECDAVGTGCIMISRKVLEEPFWAKTGGWFVNSYNKEGKKKLGLDLNFCYRAKKKGYKVYCHTDYECGHWTTMDLRLVYYTMKDLLDKLVSLHKKNK